MIFSNCGVADSLFSPKRSLLGVEMTPGEKLMPFDRSPAAASSNCAIRSGGNRAPGAMKSSATSSSSSDWVSCCFWRHSDIRTVHDRSQHCFLLAGVEYSSSFGKIIEQLSSELSFSVLNSASGRRIFLPEKY
jgi:hypothetical protein